MKTRKKVSFKYIYLLLSLYCIITIILNHLPSKQSMILGLTGNYASGKDCVAEILQKMNFYHISYSNLLREELKQQKKEITRDTLMAIGNELRQRHGADILSQRAVQKVLDGENYAFTSIRNPGEVQFLQKRPDFLLINVTAPEKVRLQRIVQRHREQDPKTLAELRQKEALENKKDIHSQQLNAVAKMAKVTLNNDSSIEVLQQKVQQLVSDWMFKLQDSRPDWDHYFMNIAEQVKLRCTCMSPKKGAIIVKDKMILSTGYSGTPKKVKHCTDGGCQRCTSRHLGKMKPGQFSEPCICCHAEENAIVQAAYNGVSTNGAWMYSTFTPCVTCAKMIINAGIVEVVMKVLYPDDSGTKLLKEAGVRLKMLK